jgi:NAD(P)-dependent dehydrogenase (short-subunit alcohol dehydrogenase family)
MSRATCLPTVEDGHAERPTRRRPSHRRPTHRRPSHRQCREAIKKIEALPGGRNGKLVPLALDTASLASVRAFAQALKAAQLGPGVDILMLNAGIALNNSPGASHLTADGVETVWATNVLGHVYLAELLGEAVEAAAAKAPKGLTRIVIVSSASNYGANAATVRPQLTRLVGAHLLE